MNTLPQSRRLLTKFDIAKSTRPLIALTADHGVLDADGNPAGWLTPIATWKNRGTGPHATQPTDYYRPVHLPHTGESYYMGANADKALALIQGTAGLDPAATDVTAEIRCKLVNTGTQQTIIATSRGAILALNGGAHFEYWGSGGLHSIGPQPQLLGVDARIRLTAGASGHRITYTLDGTTWHLLSESTTPETLYLAPSCLLGAASHDIDSSYWPARIAIYHYQQWPGTTPTGTPEIHVDFTHLRGNITTFTSASGHTVTLSQSPPYNPPRIITRPTVQYWGWSDEQLLFPGIDLTGPATFISVNEWSDKKSIMWAGHDLSTYLNCQDQNDYTYSTNYSSGALDVPDATYRINGIQKGHMPSRGHFSQILNSHHPVVCTLEATLGHTESLRLGGYGGDWPFQGYIQELYYWNRKLTPAETTRIETYLIQKHNIQP